MMRAFIVICTLVVFGIHATVGYELSRYDREAGWGVYALALIQMCLVMGALFT